MQTALTFLGAAGNVTGSRYLLECDGKKVLVDCGLYQERKFADRNWDRFPVPPEQIDAVLLTHAHLDHCGLLPKLVAEGFAGEIYCTPATAEIARIILLDSAHLQEEDAAFKRKRHEREGRRGKHPEVPLYTTADAEAANRRFHPVEYSKTMALGGGVEAIFQDAGHVFGSSNIAVRCGVDSRRRIVLFSGDVGRDDRPIIDDPETPDRADYILVESTYGDRNHKSTRDVQEALGQVIRETEEAGGNLVIPAFALERSQELLYHLNELLLARQIPELLVFLDSPMAIRITEVFRNHPELFDVEMARRIREATSPFEFPGLTMTRTTEQSKAINRIRGTAIIIAGSGMCTGGRIKHHLVNNIEREENTILFVGYQASGTLGRIILDGADEVRIHGKMRQVRARIARIHGFSAHADRHELLEWLEASDGDPREVFVVHGEAGVSRNFADFVRDKTGWKISVPDYRSRVVLE